MEVDDEVDELDSEEEGDFVREELEPLLDEELDGDEDEDLI